MSLDAAQHACASQEPHGGVNTLPADPVLHDIREACVGGNHLDGGHKTGDSHLLGAPVNTLPTARDRATPTELAPSADLPPGHSARDTPIRAAGGHLPADHSPPDTHGTHVGGTTLPAATVGAPPNLRAPLATPPIDGQAQLNTHARNAVGNPHDALLLILADALDDLERARIATQNRLRSLGQVKGLADSREARTMQHIADTLGGLEHKATLDLQRAMRAHPLGPWVKRTVGIGEKQGARLLAAIGDPAARKMPSQLWQYCGHGAPSKRQRGIKSWWNPTAKMRLHLIAESCIKQRTSPYRAVYDEARMGWAARDTSDGHKHNHALRMVGKAILLDLWRESREGQR